MKKYFKPSNLLLFLIAIIIFININSIAHIYANSSAVTKIRIRIVGVQNQSLINDSTTIQYVSGFHPTTQIEKNVYADPNSPSETLAITGIVEGQTGEIVVKINKAIKIP